MFIHINREELTHNYPQTIMERVPWMKIHPMTTSTTHHFFKTFSFKTCSQHIIQLEKLKIQNYGKVFAQCNVQQTPKTYKYCKNW